MHRSSFFVSFLRVPGTSCFMCITLCFFHTVGFSRLVLELWEPSTLSIYRRRCFVVAKLYLQPWQCHCYFPLTQYLMEKRVRRKAPNVHFGVFSSTSRDFCCRSSRFKTDYVERVNFPTSKTAWPAGHLICSLKQQSKNTLQPPAW